MQNAAKQNSVTSKDTRSARKWDGIILRWDG